MNNKEIPKDCLHCEYGGNCQNRGHPEIFCVWRQGLEVLFAKAEKFVRENYPEDLAWSREQVEKEPLAGILIPIFLREYAYVVYCSGFKQSIVEKHWPHLYYIYKGFNPQSIIRNKEDVKREALEHIGNKRKVTSIIDVAEQMNNMNQRGWEEYKQRIRESAPSFDVLEELPFIGPRTKFHLARNIGFDVAKPDRHLDRIASAYGMSTAEMCEYLSGRSDVLVGIHYGVHTIDSIFWRAAAEKMINGSLRIVYHGTRSQEAGDNRRRI